MKRSLVLALTLGLGVGCSSSGQIAPGDAGPGPGPGPSGLDGNKRLVDLTPEEAARLCDDLAAKLGGYGSKKEVPCRGGTTSVDAPKSQATCVADMTRFPKACAATVNQTEDCLRVLIDGSFCGAGAPPAECNALFDPSCATGTTGSGGGTPGTPTPTPGG
ncbi:MAG: hypothetical protein NVS3B10_05830 [Polyangiales bacterium]